MSPPPTEDEEAFARRHLRHNFVALGMDHGFFLVGLSFASQSTVLPAFVLHLGAPNIVIGAIPAIMTLGWFLPSLLAAGHTETLSRKLPFVLRYTLWERIPFLVLALVAFLLADAAPGLALMASFLMLTVLTVTGGLLIPAWMDIVGKAIPVELRGRFSATSSLLGSVGGFLASFGTTAILAAVPVPQSYGVCFLGSTTFMAASYAALAFTREPPSARTSPPVSLGAYLRRLPGLLRRDRNFSWFLFARSFNVVGTMASGFYTVYGLRAYAAPTWQVGVFTSALLSGQLMGNVALGWLADRVGNRLILIAGAAAAVAANLVALASRSLDVFTLVFVLSGVQMAAMNVSSFNVLLEFSPRIDERPTYVALGNAVVAPVAFCSPLLGGLMADGLGFEWVLVVGGLSGAVGVGLLLTRVRDPRHLAAMAREGSPGEET